MNPMNSGETSASSPVRPQPTPHDQAIGGADEAAAMQRKAKSLARRIEELDEIAGREAGRRPILSPVPGRRTAEELLEHNVTHSPPKPWCPIAPRHRAPEIHTRQSRKKFQT